MKNIWSSHPWCCSAHCHFLHSPQLQIRGPSPPVNSPPVHPTRDLRASPTCTAPESWCRCRRWAPSPSRSFSGVFAHTTRHRRSSERRHSSLQIFSSTPSSKSTCPGLVSVDSRPFCSGWLGLRKASASCRERPFSLNLRRTSMSGKTTQIRRKKSFTF